MQDAQQHIMQPIAQSAAAKWSYISLFYSMFYFFSLYAGFDRYSQLQVIATFVCYLLFLVCFLLAMRYCETRSQWPILGIILVAFITSSFHPGANALFGYAAFFSSFYFATKRANAFLAINIAAQLSAAFAFDLLHIFYLGPSLGVSISLHIFGRFTQKEHIHQYQQQQKRLQIKQLATIAERERIARDMHDLLGHSLSSLALKSELAEKLIEKERYQQAQDEIKQVAALARETLSEVRQAVTGLKQSGLKAQISALEQQLESAGFTTKSQIEFTQLTPTLETTLIMLCKEWVTNIVRHSNGNCVDISLTQNQHDIALNIVDNGQVNKLSPGNGISGIASRVAEHNGKYSINTENGVHLSVQLAAH